MSDCYSARLKDFSEANHETYHKVLNDCKTDIIDRFGGLYEMIHLCLTNPEFSSDTYKSQFDSFKSLME